MLGTAAAEISRQRLLGLGQRGARFLRKERGAGHDHAVGAVAALRRLFGDEGGLHRVWLFGAAHPSMVVTRWPAAADTGNRHERTALPSRCTVQAPHCPRPQPNFAPVRPMTSRMTHSRGISGATSTL